MIKGLNPIHQFDSFNYIDSFLKEFDETPTKQQFNGLKDMLTLTPETDDDCAKHKDAKKATQMVSRPLTDQVSFHY